MEILQQQLLAIKTGAIDYLPKPAEIDQIYDALTNLRKHFHHHQKIQ